MTTDYEFIIENFNSFIDNVLLNVAPNAYADMLMDEEDGPGYLHDALLGAMKEWRRRIERGPDRGGVVECVRLVYVDAIIGTTPYSNGRPIPKCEGVTYIVADDDDLARMNADPHQTEEWWAAIDADIEYQREFRGEDE